MFYQIYRKIVSERGWKKFKEKMFVDFTSSHLMRSWLGCSYAFLLISKPSGSLPSCKTTLVVVNPPKETHLKLIDASARTCGLTRNRNQRFPIRRKEDEGIVSVSYKSKCKSCATSVKYDTSKK